MNKRNIDFTPKKQMPEALLPRKPEIIVLRPVKEDGRYLYIRDICQILGCGRSMAYNVIAKLQLELPDHGLKEPPGRISREYFMRRLYGMSSGKEGFIDTANH